MVYYSLSLELLAIARLELEVARKLPDRSNKLCLIGGNIYQLIFIYTLFSEAFKLIYLLSDGRVD